MRNRLLSLLFIGLISGVLFVSCKNNDDDDDNNNNNNNNPTPVQVEKKQRALLLDFTATWCQYCGPALPYFLAAAESQKDNCVAIAVHTTSSELTPYYRKANNDTVFAPQTYAVFKSSISEDFSGIPTFGVNADKIPNYTDKTYLQTQFEQKIQNYSNDDPTVNVGMEITPIANGVKVRHNTKFFKAGSGEYYLAFYLLDDGITHRQNVNGVYQDNFQHGHIIRCVLGSGEPADLLAQGKKIASGNIAADKYYQGEFEYKFDATLFELPSKYDKIEKFDSWNVNDYEIAAIIWKKVGNDYVFENGIMMPIK